MKTAAVLAFALMMPITSACSRQARPKSQTSNQAAGPSDPTIEVSSADNDSSSDDPCSQMFSNFYVEADSLAYNDYEVARLHKVVHDKESGFDMPDTYAVLRSRGKVIATFDGIYHPAGNFTDFGFASLLGGETKQLVVSQVIPRNGRHWVVDVSSDGATLFDSSDWDTGGEDVCVHDVDGDGIAEISMPIQAFWGFETMSMADSPMPGVVFKYDSKSRKFLPDKSSFARGLTDIDEDVKAIDQNEKPQGGFAGRFLAVRLDIFLHYVYAGREKDAWSFFEKTYNLDDKKEIGKKIRARLDREPVYRFVYGKSRGRS